MQIAQTVAYSFPFLPNFSAIAAAAAAAHTRQRWGCGPLDGLLPAQAAAAAAAQAMAEQEQRDELLARALQQQYLQLHLHQRAARLQRQQQMWWQADMLSATATPDTAAAVRHVGDAPGACGRTRASTSS